MPNIDAWLSALENRFRHAPIQLGLARVKKVAEALQIDTFPCVVITVGGTNGKGSTVKALETLYHASGYQVGAYTSPHLLIFNERIRLNGQDIDDNSLCEAFTAIEKIADADTLTYFEFTTLAALWFFKKNLPDVVILEVGMGGRLDATNIIDADLAIITTVDYDHQAYLGHTLEEIGYEKAGILREDKPFIFASDSVPNSVREVADKVRAVGYYIGESVDTSLLATTTGALHPASLNAAIKATQLLRQQLPVSDSALESLKNFSLTGRLQTVSPGIVVDVAHNPQSVKRLSDWLHAAYPSQRVHAVFSALNDKALADMVAIMKQQVILWHVAPLQAERAASEFQLREAFDSFPSDSVLWYNSLSSAFHAAKGQRKLGEVVVVFGSFLTVAAVLI